MRSYLQLNVKNKASIQTAIAQAIFILAENQNQSLKIR